MHKAVVALLLIHRARSICPHPLHRRRKKWGCSTYTPCFLLCNTPNTPIRRSVP
ncbi:unnamed protein product [Ixodes pacificus]